MARKLSEADKIKQDVLKALAQINADDSKDLCYTIGSNAYGSFKRWSTGIPQLDEILGGGMPEGIICEIFGAESSGKTSLVHWLGARHYSAVYIPIEGGYDEAIAKAYGCKPGNYRIADIQDGEKALRFMNHLADLKTPFIALDSVASIDPTEEVSKQEKMIAKMEGKAEPERLGGRSKILNRWLKPLIKRCERSGTTAIFVNQIRDNVGATMFQPSYVTTGGRALKFYSRIRLEVARAAFIKIPNKNPANKSADKIVGIEQRIKVIKNKSAPPMGEATLNLFFDRGYVLPSQKDAIRKELMKEHNAFWKKKKEEISSNNKQALKKVVESFDDELDNWDD